MLVAGGASRSSSRRAVARADGDRAARRQSESRSAGWKEVRMAMPPLTRPRAARHADISKTFRACDGHRVGR
ncbi:hypothetical protein C1I93_07400 [Micromonospora endophytica]|uniref:Uncharacterized protein n=1 Tax=Micromonospora endophytica TaxID=515350 RepID=A0A2W2D5L8_9ACTN|nr:hypothetical protein C1I93_07400 [Micromonospora endophytica]RIW46087.1 hypothetical protein D3H59_13835 [Micromonospora endophytica]